MILDNFDDFDYQKTTDTVFRVQKYLIGKGEFQLNQMLTLQDDEILRLKSSLQMIRDKINKESIKSEKKIKKLKERKKQLKQIIHEIKMNKALIFQEINSKYSSKVKKLKRSHTKEVTLLNESASRFVIEKKSKAESDTDTEILNETIKSINDKIDSIRSERESFIQDSKDQANDAINRYKIQAKTKRVRCEELREKIIEMTNSINKIKSDKKKRLKSIYNKSNEYESQMSSSKTQFLSQLSSFMDEDINDSGLIQLENQVKLATASKEEVLERTEKCKMEFKEKLKELTKQKESLEVELQLAKEKNNLKEMVTFIYAENEIIAQTQQKIKRKNDILKKLREENLAYRRKINECDYIIHGRTGNYQRFTEISRQDASFRYNSSTE